MVARGPKSFMIMECEAFGRLHRGWPTIVTSEIAGQRTVESVEAKPWPKPGGALTPSRLSPIAGKPYGRPHGQKAS